MKPKNTDQTAPPISRTEKKRQAKQVESLTVELSRLSLSEIKQLPCSDELREELALAHNLKGSAGKRQVKFISKELRRISIDPLLAFLENKKGSKLKKNIAFHDIEKLRDTIIEEAINMYKDEDFSHDSLLPSIQVALEKYPEADLNSHSLQQSALRFARTRKPVHKKEIFRTLQAAQEKAQYKKTSTK